MATENQAPLQPKEEQKHWFYVLDPREQAQIAHARHYREHFSHSGAPGHGQFLLIAKLANLLDERALRDRGGA